MKLYSHKAKFNPNNDSNINTKITFKQYGNVTKAAQPNKSLPILQRKKYAGEEK